MIAHLPTAHKFICRLLNGASPLPATEPDTWQVGIEWIPIPELGEDTNLPEKSFPRFSNPMR